MKGTSWALGRYQIHEVSLVKPFHMIFEGDHKEGGMTQAVIPPGWCEKVIHRFFRSGGMGDFSARRREQKLEELQTAESTALFCRSVEGDGFFNRG